MSILVGTPMLSREILIGNQWLVKGKIGSGSFGEIYEAYDIHTNQRVAVKIESTDSKYPQLLEEHKVYLSIHQQAKNHELSQAYNSQHNKHHHNTNNNNSDRYMIGFPRIYWFGSIESGKYHALVMELLGDSLETLYNRCNRKFTLKTVLQLSFQLIDRIEQQHRCGWLHRDIKPDNFLMGTGEMSSTLYVIDMGLCKQYKDAVTGEHIPFKDSKKLIGTPRYASLNTHLGIEQCRRDDLESIGYMLLYLLIGKLPWQGLKAKNKQEKYERISAKKNSVTVEQLCKACPSEFAKYLNYCRQLKFQDRPDYKYLKKLFNDLYLKKGYKDDLQYDWMIPSTAPSSFHQPINQYSQHSTAMTKRMSQQIGILPATAAAQHQQQQHHLQQQQQATNIQNIFTIQPIMQTIDLQAAEKENSVRRQQQQHHILQPATATGIPTQNHILAYKQASSQQNQMLPPQHPTVQQVQAHQQQQQQQAAAFVYQRQFAGSPFMATALHSPAVSSALDPLHSSNCPSPVQAHQSQQQQTLAQHQVVANVISPSRQQYPTNNTAQFVPIQHASAVNNTIAAQPYQTQPLDYTFDVSPYWYAAANPQQQPQQASSRWQQPVPITSASASPLLNNAQLAATHPQQQGQGHSSTMVQPSYSRQTSSMTPNSGTNGVNGATYSRGIGSSNGPQLPTPSPNSIELQDKVKQLQELLTAAEQQRDRYKTLYTESENAVGKYVEIIQDMESHINKYSTVAFQFPHTMPHHVFRRNNHAANTGQQQQAINASTSAQAHASVLEPLPSTDLVAANTPNNISVSVAVRDGNSSNNHLKSSTNNTAKRKLDIAAIGDENNNSNNSNYPSHPHNTRLQAQAQTHSQSQNPRSALPMQVYDGSNGNKRQATTSARAANTGSGDVNTFPHLSTNIIPATNMNISQSQPATYYLDTSIAQQASNLLHTLQSSEPYSSNSDGSRPSIGTASFEAVNMPYHRAIENLNNFVQT